MNIGTEYNLSRAFSQNQGFVCKTPIGQILVVCKRLDVSTAYHNPPLDLSCVGLSDWIFLEITFFCFSSPVLGTFTFQSKHSAAAGNVFSHALNIQIPAHILPYFLLS